ncbi:hypothetical protein SZN_25639 [Streptomyces zinciresistens K42]|uniref:DUF4395 domain-containing protein n=1 Tax=Streptomyces zinciresistens K42 TaxID=700597 RepID=G2GHY8_9ACTN|nr:DUF4395 domain-containing protein [Streptomyces zinciresistens]EGX56866.1 hypothetical protein SZN_25639 [Streptomyces zinciresistens K42]
MTAVVLAAVLTTGSARLPARQTPAFARGAVGGVGRSPYGVPFRTAVRPRLGPPTAFEAPQPPRFTQAVGLVLAGLGPTGYALGPDRLGRAATGAALAAAFLNAVLGHCPDCEMYLPARRLTAPAG